MATGTVLQKSDVLRKQSKGIRGLGLHLMTGQSVFWCMCLESPCLGDSMGRREIRENMSCLVYPCLFPFNQISPTKNLLHYWVYHLAILEAFCIYRHTLQCALHPGGIGKSKPMAGGRSTAMESRFTGGPSTPRTRAWSVLGGGCVAQAGSRAAGIWTTAEDRTEPLAPFSTFKAD